jgi:hypothetical protein
VSEGSINSCKACHPFFINKNEKKTLLELVLWAKYIRHEIHSMRVLSGALVD